MDPIILLSKRPKRQKINQRGEMSQAGKGSTAIYHLPVESGFALQSSGIEFFSFWGFSIDFYGSQNHRTYEICFVYFFTEQNFVNITLALPDFLNTKCHKIDCF